MRRRQLNGAIPACEESRKETRFFQKTGFLAGVHIRNYGLRRSGRPGRAPVCLPDSSTTWPLTMTYRIPLG